MAVRPVITSNGVPFLQMRSVGSHSTSGREKEGIKERMRGEETFCVTWMYSIYTSNYILLKNVYITINFTFSLSLITYHFVYQIYNIKELYHKEAFLQIVFLILFLKMPIYSVSWIFNLIFQIVWIEINSLTIF